MIKFCPKCHREAYRVIEERDKIKVIQGDKTVLNLNRSSSVMMDFSCPSGHTVNLQIGEVK